MPSRKLLRSFLALWLITGMMLLLASVETVRNARAAPPHVNPHLVALGTVEAVAAILFLIPRTIRLGAIGLLITLAVAFGAHAVLGSFRGDLVLYAATVLFVLVHGPLTPGQLRVAVSRTSA